MATIHDVAKIAGVSVTTVSRVLNNRGYISEKTRKLVYDTMNELNYQPNEIARSLLKKQSNIIGLIIPSVSSPFFGELTAFIEFFAYQSGFKLLLCNSNLDPIKEKEYIEMMKRNRVDGIIMGSHTLEVEEYTELHRPIVTIDRKISDNIPYISSDNYLGGIAASRLLISKGCKKIAHICGNLSLDLLANQRTDAFLTQMKEANIEQIVIQTDMNVFDYPQYERIIRRMFREHPDIDGVFATNDIIASFIIKIGRELNYAVPERLKIVGYDDIQLASWSTPSITTIKQPIESIGELSVELIRKQLEDELVEMSNILPIELIERETT